MKKVSWLILGIVLVSLLSLGGPAGRSHNQVGLASVTVCPQGPPHCRFASIQAAVSVVAEGGEVRVHPGEYRENVVIRKPLTLSGAEPSIGLASTSRLMPLDFGRTTLRV